MSGQPERSEREVVVDHCGGVVRTAGGSADRGGDGLVDVGVEHARDDVVGVELVVGDHAASACAAASSMSWVMSDGLGVEQAAEDAGEGEHVVDLVREVASVRSRPRRRARRPRPGRSRGPGWPARRRSAFGAMVAMSSASRMSGAETPMNTSAPRRPAQRPR